MCVLRYRFGKPGRSSGLERVWVRVVPKVMQGDSEWQRRPPRSERHGSRSFSLGTHRHDAAKVFPRVTFEFTGAGMQVEDGALLVTLPQAELIRSPRRRTDQRHNIDSTPAPPM